MTDGARGSATERDRRLAFAIPPLPDPDDAAGLDPADPDDRALLIREAHPELDTERQTVTIDGSEMNPRLHLMVHEIIATQLANDDPPQVWATAQRLRRLGYGRHEILHMLSAAMAPQLWAAMRDQRDYDLEQHRSALAALPDAWERERPAAGPPSAARDPQAAARKRRKVERAARRRNRRR
jgi:hypothetical protein